MTKNSEKIRYCFVTWARDKEIVEYYIAAIVINIVVISALTYGIFYNIFTIQTINFITIVEALAFGILILGIANGFCFVFIKGLRKPIVYNEGISISSRIACDDLRNNAWLRIFIRWDEIEKMSIEYNNAKEWNVIFTHKKGFEIKISSNMGYEISCLTNLIRLGDELKKKKVEVNISNAAIQRAKELEETQENK